MSNPKRQHYLPQMLLKHFVDDKDQLWFFEQGAPKKRVEKRDIKSTFRKTNVYTFTNPDGSRDYAWWPCFFRDDRRGVHYLMSGAMVVDASGQGWGTE